MRSPEDSGLPDKIRFGERQKHELARVQPKMLREKTGIEFAAKRHQLRFDPLRRGVLAACRNISPSSFCGDGRLGAAGNEQAADKSFVVFENVKAVSDRGAVFERR